VKQIAADESIPVFQPSTPRDAEFQEMIAVMQPDISVVVAYGTSSRRKSSTCRCSEL
jgi:methionyl-tRNA formyltransferase